MDSEALPMPSADAWTRAVKAATRDLIDLAGGLARAAAKVGRSTTTVQRWGSLGEEDLAQVIPLRAAWILEADTGMPMVTQAMAEMHGRSLGPGAAERQRSVLSAHSGVARSVAAYQATFAEAIEDGVLTPTELNSLAERAGAVTQATARMQAVSSAEAAAPVRLGSIAPC